jgi:Cof subfamily protein (haloacid dehalogenase superfamily)
MRTLVAFDLDGTLLDDHSELPAAHERAVRHLQQRGVLVAIVTGRSVPTSRWVHERLRLTTPIGCFNGGWVGHPGREPLAARVLSAVDVRAIIDATRGWDGALCAYRHAEDWIMDRELEHTRVWRSFYRMPIPVLPDLFAAWEGTSCKMMFVCAEANMPAALARLRSTLSHRFIIAQSQPDRVEIMPRGIDKAWGLARLAEHLGVPRERVWAVGDNDNDREMLAWAGHGCIMGQAGDHLKAVARHVLPSVNARGIAALDLLMRRNGF